MLQKRADTRRSDLPLDLVSLSTSFDASNEDDIAALITVVDEVVDIVSNSGGDVVVLIEEVEIQPRKHGAHISVSRRGLLLEQAMGVISDVPGVVRKNEARKIGSVLDRLDPAEDLLQYSILAGDTVRLVRCFSIRGRLLKRLNHVQGRIIAFGADWRAIGICCEHGELFALSNQHGEPTRRTISWKASLRKLMCSWGREFCNGELANQT